ncbi:MAG: four helix bundle protein [Patescibacteria group bacterium]
MEHGTEESNTEKTFHQKLQLKIDEYVHGVYALSKKFPKEEAYGITSQLRRASLSVPLNYIEGYARQRDKVYKNFLEISYGSLKESLYLIKFSYDENLISKEQYEKYISLGDEIGAMIWSILRKI